MPHRVAERLFAKDIELQNPNESHERRRHQQQIRITQAADPSDFIAQTERRGK